MRRRSSGRHWPVLLPFALLLAALGYWNIASDPTAKGKPLAEDEQIIDFYMLNSHTTQLNEEGQLHYSFRASRVDHLQQSDISLMQNPNLELWRGTEYPWHITGLRGEASPGGKEIQLYEQVKVERHDEQQRPFLLTTTHLTYLTDTDHAYTAEPVQIDSAQGVTTATGMNAYLKQGTISLLSTVRGRYETD